jgi:hypothetical protein
LPPDNFQEQPIELIAHRTSPTNIGLALLTNLSAYDFGFLSASKLIERTTQTLNTLKQMERYKGHFYNWYHTQSLHPLLPKYISTVDSGNLVGHLLILKQGLLAIPAQKISGVKLFEGLRDTLRVLINTLLEKDNQSLQRLMTKMNVACGTQFYSYHALKIQLDNLSKDFSSVFEMLNDTMGSETLWWKNALNIQFKQEEENLKIFSPWDLLKTAPAEFKKFDLANSNTSLNELLKAAMEIQVEAKRFLNEKNALAEKEWIEKFNTSLNESIRQAEEQVDAIENLAQQCDELADIEWDFLFDKSRNQFTIGFNVQEHCCDSSFYDLLASEARFCIFIGIAQGKLPEESWFALSRLLTKVEGEPILLSWSGSMFEYLMPLLVMPTYENTLLDQTYKAVVQWQVDYGKQTNLPWGISESGFNMINANSEYQYRAFGAPGLGLKRGLEEDSVIAPYASALALMVSPRRAFLNLQLLSEKEM